MFIAGSLPNVFNRTVGCHHRRTISLFSWLLIHDVLTDFMS